MINSAKEARESLRNTPMNGNVLENPEDLHLRGYRKGYLACLEGPEVKALEKELEELRKSLKVMREIAIQVHAGEYVEVPSVIDEEFNKRMNNVFR